MGGPARQEETNVKPLKLRTVPTSATQDPDAETDPPLPGEQDMSTATDGAKTKVVVNKYERNPKNRKKCIEAHGGPQCQVCEMTFEEVYGVHGAGYIHVHHVTPLSEIGEAHEPNPFRDLKPVCPNCHAMLHRQKPDGTYLELEELRVLLRKYRASYRFQSSTTYAQRHLAHPRSRHQERPRPRTPKTCGNRSKQDVAIHHFRIL